MSIFDSLAQLLIGHEERMWKKVMTGLLHKKQSSGWWRRFSGKSKMFKKNQRRGL
jgi:hypothetical protein